MATIYKRKKDNGNYSYYFNLSINGKRIRRFAGYTYKSAQQTLKKTEYESVKITCYDNDPEIAKLIIDSIIVFYNQKGQNLYRIKIKEVMEVAKGEFNKWKSIKDSLHILLNSYKEKYGIQEILLILLFY